MWYGNFNGTRGFKTYRFLTSNSTPGFPPAARYSKDQVFSLLYRRNCELPDKKLLTEGIREILNFKGKYLTITERYNNSSTIEFYCKLDTIPDNETMAKLEQYLQTADFFPDSD